MATEWTAAGALVLLAAALALQVADWLGPGAAAGRLSTAASGARLAATLVLVAAAILGAVQEGAWSAMSVRQVALDVAVAALAVYWALLACVRLGAARPAVDLPAIGLIVVALVVPPAGAPGSTPALPLLIHWGLILIGVGALAVAAGTALLLALRSVLVRHGPGAASRQGHWPQRAVLHLYLYHAAALGTVALGAGLAIGLWWTWRTAGTLANGDPRQVWTVAAALLAAAGLWAARLGRQSGRWTALLAVASGGVALIGLLAGLDLYRLMAF